MARFNLSSVPRGLMDLLGVRSTGEMPRELDESANLSVDGTEFYLSSRLETQAFNGTAPIAGFNRLGVVPPNEMWILMQANGTIQGGDAGVACQFAPALNPGSGAVLLGDTLPVAALGLAYAATNPVRVALPAGCQFGLHVFSITGGAYTALTTTGITLLVYRLRAGG